MKYLPGFFYIISFITRVQSMIRTNIKLDVTIIFYVLKKNSIFPEMLPIIIFSNSPWKEMADLRDVQRQ